MAEKFDFYLVKPGPRPKFVSVARRLWGADDFDSDGNSRNAEDNQWTELTLIRRPDYIERIDIYPISEKPLVLMISSSSSTLAQQAALFLAETTNGTIYSEWPYA